MDFIGTSLSAHDGTWSALALPSAMAGLDMHAYVCIACMLSGVAHGGCTLCSMHSAMRAEDQHNAFAYLLAEHVVGRRVAWTEEPRARLCSPETQPQSLCLLMIWTSFHHATKAFAIIIAMP